MKQRFIVEREFSLIYKISNEIGENDFCVYVDGESERYYVKIQVYPSSELKISGDPKGYTSIDDADKIAKEIADNELSRRLSLQHKLLRDA